jgi:hypothetical protein
MPNSATMLRWLGGAGLAAAAVLWLVGLNLADASTRALLLFLAGVCLNVGVLAFVAWVAVDVLAEEHLKAMEPLITEQRRLADAVAEIARTTAETNERDTPGQ